MRASRIEGVGGGSMGLGSSRAASSARGSSKPAVKKALKNAKKTKPLAEPKSAVKVKYNKQAMEKAILKERMPVGQSEGAKRARDIESRMNNGIKKIDTNPFKTTGFSNLKRKVASMDTPVNRARAKAKAKALKAANAGSKKR